MAKTRQWFVMAGKQTDSSDHSFFQWPSIFRLLVVHLQTSFFRVCVDAHKDTLVPTDTRTCILNKKCKVSKWSEWRLDRECDVTMVSLVPRMVKTRHVERLPQGKGKPCPHLREYKLYDGSVVQTTSANGSDIGCKNRYVERSQILLFSVSCPVYFLK